MNEPDGAATGNGADDAVPLPSGVDSQLHTLLPLSVSRRVAPSAISPIQPQVNPEQMQAVKDILQRDHGALPYLVFGPPGTGSGTRFL